MNFKSPLLRSLAVVPAVCLFGGCANMSWPVVQERPMPQLDQELVAAIDRQIMASAESGEIMLGAFDNIGGQVFEQREMLVRSRYFDEQDGLLVGAPTDVD